MLILFLACVVSAPDDDEEDSDDTDVVDDSGVIDDHLDQIDPDTLPAGPDPCRAPELVTVDYVVDGDTAKVISSRGQESVRFIGIDTPEIGYDGDASECFGDDAQAFSREHLEGRRAWLTFDSTCTDYFDRTLAYVHTGTGDQDFFVRALLRGGYGHAFPFVESDTFEDLFDGDEDWAREHDAGGWATCSW